WLLCLSGRRSLLVLLSFDAAPTMHVYTLPLHDALPIFGIADRRAGDPQGLVHRLGTGRQAARRAVRTARQALHGRTGRTRAGAGDRKSTRLNSSHVKSSYAGFCLKKKTTLSAASCAASA